MIVIGGMETPLDQVEPPLKKKKGFALKSKTKKQEVKFYWLILGKTWYDGQEFGREKQRIRRD